MAETFTDTEIKSELKRVPEWDYQKKSLERTFEFEDFEQAMEFVNSVAEIAEDVEHYPDIEIRYNRVRIVVRTHREGGLSDIDFEVAEKIDNLSE